MTSKNSYWKLSFWNLKKRIASFVFSFVLWFFILPVSTLVTLDNLVAGALDDTASKAFIRYVRQTIVTSCTPNNYAAVFVTIGLGIFLAISAYSWMNDQKKCDFYCSMPVKKTTRFIYLSVNSLVIYLLPLTINLLLALLVTALKGFFTGAFVLAALFGLLYLTLAFLSAYFLGTIACMISGNMVISTILSVIFLAIEPITNTLLYTLKSDFFDTFSTAGLDSDYNLIAVGKGYTSPLIAAYDLFYKINSAGNGFFSTEHFTYGLKFLLFLALQAVIYCFLAFFIYQKRPMQIGGKHIVFSIAKPIIKTVLLIVGALYAAVIFRDFGYNHASAFGIFGLICGLLLIQAIVQITMDGEFKACLHGMKSFVIGAAVTVFVYAVFALDLTGYDTYLPKEDQIASITYIRSGEGAVVYYDQNGNYESSTSYLCRNLNLTDQAAIDTIYQGLSQAISSGKYYYNPSSSQAILLRSTTVDNDSEGFATTDESALDSDDFAASADGSTSSGSADGVSDAEISDYTDITVAYHLNNGRTVYREYFINSQLDQDIYHSFYNTDEYREAVNPFDDEIIEESLKQDDIIVSATYETYNLNEALITVSSDQALALKDALSKDMLSRDYSITDQELPIGCFSFYVSSNDQYSNTYLSYNRAVYSTDKNTIKLLKEYNLYDDPKIYPQDIDSLQVYRYDSQLEGMEDTSVTVYPGDDLFDELVENCYLSSATSFATNTPMATDNSDYYMEINSLYGNYPSTAYFYKGQIPENIDMLFAENVLD